MAYPFTNVSGRAAEVWERISNILSHIILGVWLLIHAGITVKPQKIAESNFLTVYKLGKS